MDHDPEPPPASANDQGVLFHLEVSMGVQHLTAVRRFVADLTDSVVHDSELASRMALAAHELLENAVKYSSDPRRLVTLQLWAKAKHKVHVTVLNASNESLVAPLRELVHALNAAPDPVANYQRLIACSMQHENGSGLGLARIRAEAEMELSCDFHDDLLAVTAQASIGDAP